MTFQETISNGEGVKPRRSMSERIADQLRREILSAAIEPGQSIKQDHIAQRFGVSQAPVREALRQLASEDLVTYQVNCGVRVPSLEQREVEETAALRLRLEPSLITPAARNFGDADRRRATAALEQISQAGDVAALLQANEEFHEALYSPAGQPVTLHLVRQLRQRYVRYLGFMWHHSRHAQASLDEHQALLNLICDGQAQAARELLKTHIKASTEAIMKTMALHCP